MNYLVCMRDKETKILLDEISVLIIETQQACITNGLISELVGHGIKVIFCDGQHNPCGEIVPYAGSQDSYKKIKRQILWSEPAKKSIWAKLVRMKIHNQARLLLKRKEIQAAQTLQGYEKEVELEDKTNREGLAAKVYFAALFGKTFDRRKPSILVNTYLDYGYSILLSFVNREIAAFGYLPQIGIHHIGETNPFNLGCDIMEPFRPFVDAFVVDGTVNQENFKGQLLSCFGLELLCDDRKTIFDNAIHIFVLSFLKAMCEGNPKMLVDVKFLDEQL